MNSNREIWKRLVAVEGIDGAGTTTLTRNISKALNKLKISHNTGCEPTDGKIGKLIREALSGKYPVEPETLALLFAADRREHLYSPEGIQKKIKTGNIYITDRYFFSSLAYQSLNAEWDWVESLNSGFPLPGYLIYLGLPVEEAQKRLSNRDETEIFDRVDLQHRISASYEKSIEAFRNLGMKILEIDSREAPEQVRDKAMDFIKELLRAD